MLSIITPLPLYHRGAGQMSRFTYNLIPQNETKSKNTFAECSHAHASMCRSTTEITTCLSPLYSKRHLSIKQNFACNFIKEPL